MIVAAVPVDVDRDRKTFAVTVDSLVNEHIRVDLSENHSAAGRLLKHQVREVDVSEWLAGHAEIKCDMALRYVSQFWISGCQWVEGVPFPQ